MKKALFWSGLILQGIHLITFLVIFAPKINVPTISQETLFGIGYVIFNILTLAMIFIGAVSGDEK